MVRWKATTFSVDLRITRGRIWLFLPYICLLATDEQPVWAITVQSVLECWRCQYCCMSVRTCQPMQVGICRHQSRLKCENVAKKALSLSTINKWCSPTIVDQVATLIRTASASVGSYCYLPFVLLVTEVILMYMYQLVQITNSSRMLLSLCCVCICHSILDWFLWTRSFVLISAEESDKESELL